MPDVELRPLTREDYWLLSTWLREPLVARWWADDPSLIALEERYGASIDGTDPTQVLIATHLGTAYGLIQWYRYADEPEYVAELGNALELPDGATSIDYLVGPPEFRGRGLAGAMVAATLDLVRDSGSRVVVVPVHADNEDSWRMLERCGFHRVGAADLAPDNPDDDRRHVVYRLDLDEQAPSPSAAAGRARTGGEARRDLGDDDRRHLRRCVELAREAFEAGDFPFGSVLVGGDGAVLAERRNSERSRSPVGHPELDLAVWAGEHLDAEQRASATAYTSGEHCAMCSAAHAWAGLGTIVYAVSSAQLDEWRGEWGADASPVRTLAINEVASGVRVRGPDPDLVEEMRDLHEQAFRRG